MQEQDRKINPLKWPVNWRNASTWDRFLSDFPIVGMYRRVHRELSKQLATRSFDCLNLWGNNVQRYRLLLVISPIAKEYGRWPNCFFIPDDPCEIVFWDPTMQLLTVEAFGVIERSLSLRKLDEDLSTMTYGEFIEKIARLIVIEKTVL